VTISPAQAKAARLLLGWSQDALAGAACVSTSSVKTFEYGKKLPSPNIRSAIQLALEAASVIFGEENGEGAGVSLRKDVAD
jgi:transcriptional regulator with XRE-family HTH domain